jgi:DNA-binding NarL/FixJ family response regulator
MTTAAHLLVVFPNPRLRAAVAGTLVSAGAVVVGAAAGIEEALALAPAVRLDGIVLGTTVLAGDAGIALRRLAAAAPGAALAVVGSDTSAAYASAVRRAGATVYVPLDHDPVLLARTVIAAASPGGIGRAP